MASPATDQFCAALQGFFWPKVFFDILTKNLDGIVKPIPVLQLINLVLSILAFAMEWPLKFIAGSGVHRSVEARLIFLPLAALCSILMYQSFDAGVYYLVALIIYFVAYSEGEVSSCLLSRSKDIQVTDNPHRASAPSPGLFPAVAAVDLPRSKRLLSIPVSLISFRKSMR